MADRPDKPPPREPERFEPVAGIAAIALPGAGHVVLGETRRGVLVAVGVLGLFFSGLFVGGIDVIDSREDRLWFIGQALVGPIAVGIDRLHQSYKVADRSEPTGTRSRHPDESPVYEKSLAKMNELGTLFCTIAGMLNLIAILDAAFHGRARPEPVVAG